jgi:hypothetical protein
LQNKRVLPHHNNRVTTQHKKRVTGQHNRRVKSELYKYGITGRIVSYISERTKDSAKKRKTL